MLDGTLLFYDVMGLRFTASDGFTLTNGVYQASTGVVDIGFAPQGAATVENLLEFSIDTNNTSRGFALDPAARPSFQAFGGTFAITAAGGSTPFWDPEPLDKVDIGQLVGSGFSFDPLAGSAFRVSALKFQPTQLALAKLNNDPAQGQVKLQGTATFDAIPVAADLGLQVAVNGTNYVLADASGFSLTGLEASVTIPNGKTIGKVVVSGTLGVGYDFATKSFEFDGSVSLSTTDGGVGKAPTLQGAAGVFHMTVADDKVQALGVSVGGMFNLRGLSISTYPGQPLGFDYDLTEGQFEVFGKVQVQTAGQEITVSVDLGSVSAPGIVIKDGALQSLKATVNAAFEFKALTLRTDEAGGLQLAYDRTSDTFGLTGGVTLVIAPNSPAPQQIGASFVAADGGPGLVIRDGKVTSFAVALSGAFNIYGLKLAAVGASVAWDPKTDAVALGGTLTADFRAFQTSLTLGTAQSPGIVIDDGNFRVENIRFELDNASIGTAIQINDLVVSYRSVTDPQGRPSYDVDVDVDVVIAGEFQVGGSFDLVDGRLDTISLYLRDNEGVPIGDTGLILTAIGAKVTNIETPAQIVVTGSISVSWGEPVTFLGKTVELFRVTGTVTASASELIIDAQALLGAYSTDGGVTYQAVLGSGDAKLTLDWAQEFYSLHVAVDGLAGIFDVEGDIVFAAGRDLAFLATAEVVVPAFVPFIGGLELGGFGFFFDHVFPHDNVGTSTTLAGWITLDIIWPFTVGFQVYYDASGNETTSLIGGGAVANYKKELMPSEPSTFTYLSDFAGAVPAAATSLVARVDWSRAEGDAGLKGAPTFRVRKTVVGQAPVYIDEKDFAANGISFIDKPNFSGPTRRAVQIVGSAADPYRPLGADYALEVKFTTDGTNPFPDYPNPAAEDRLQVDAAYHIPVPVFGPTGGPQPYVPTLPTSSPTAAFPVTLSGRIDEALIPRARVSLYRVAVNDPFGRGVLVGTSGLTAVNPPAGGVNWTATFQVPIDGLDPTRYTLYSVLDDGSAADPATAAQSNPPIQTGPSAPFAPVFAVQGRVANQAGDAEVGWLVFLDYNRNGVQDANEPGDRTNADGVYGFTRTFAAATGWAPVPVNSIFDVRLVEPAGIARYAPVAPSPATFNGSAASTVNLPVREFSAIKGTIFADATSSGQAAGNAGVAGATVYIDLDGDGRRDPGDPTAVTDTAGHYVFGSVAPGSYIVRVDLASLSQTTPRIAYVVPAGTLGSDSGANVSYGTRFTARRAVTITQLGVFDDGSNGLARTLTAVLYDAATHAELARLTFTPADPGTLVGGSRFKPLAQPITLPAGFAGVIMAYGYGPGERAGNIGIVPGTWTVDGGANLLAFDASTYAGAPNVFPTVAANPASGSAWAAGTFTYRQDPWVASSPSSNLRTATIAAGGFSLSEGNDIGVLPPAYITGTVTGGAIPTGGGGGTIDQARVAAINLGGAAVGLFGADPHATGSSPSTPVNAAIDTSRAVNPAPQAAYQTQAFGSDFTERVGGLTPNTKYVVRLHYAETYFNSAGQRRFSVTLNGVAALTDFDLFAAAGGMNIALIREFTVASDAGGTIAIRSFASLNNAVLNAVEVLRDSAPQAGWTVQLVADAVARAPGDGVTWAINVGGPTDGIYGSDRGATGGTVGSTTAAINTSQVTDPPPQAVLQSYRFGIFSYAATGLRPNTVYTLRLLFVETFETAVGQRRFNVSVNGVRVLTDFDIIAAAGAINTAIARSFTAASDATGTIRLDFANNAVIGAIEVREPGGPVAVAAGGTAAGDFAADNGFQGGQASIPTGSQVDTSKVSDPAPQSVYQTGRYGDSFTYTLGGLIPGQGYTLRLHFADPFARVAGQRRFNVSVNGVRVLTDFDIVAAAGAINTAWVEELNVTAGPGGTLVVAFSLGSAGQPDVSGLEVIQAGQVVATTTTDARGRYTFDQPTPGRYTVREVPPAGWRVVGGASSSLALTPTAADGQVQGAVVAADFNGDGLLDLAYSNTPGGQIRSIGVLLGGQTTVQYFTTNGAGVKLVVGDFNGDARPDIAVLNDNGDSEVSLLFNTGSADPAGLFRVDNNYWPGQHELDGVNLIDIAAGDLNADGLTDLVITYASRSQVGQGGIAAFLNGIPSIRVVRTTAVSYSQPTGVAIGDVNGDGRLDVLFGGKDEDPAFESFYVAYGDGRGGLSSPTQFLIDSGAFGGPVALGNIQGLGLPDAAFLDRENFGPNDPNYGSVQLALNGGNAPLERNPVVLDTDTQPGTPVFQQIALADVNGDLRPDLILLAASRPGFAPAKNGVMVYLNTGRGPYFQADDPHWFAIPNGGNAWDLAVADFDGDGLADIFVSNAPTGLNPSGSATLFTNQSLQGQPGTAVRLDAGGFVAGVDFDNVQLPTGPAVSGRVFDDRNRNGAVEDGEGGVGGLTVYADLNRNGRHDAGEPTAVTRPDGWYALDMLMPGTYRIGVVGDPGAWLASRPGSDLADLTVDGSPRQTDFLLSRSLLNTLAPLTITAGTPLLAWATRTGAASDGPGRIWRFSLDPGAPAGASIDPKTGQVTWTPTAPGVYTLAVRLRDALEPTTTQVVALAVTVNPTPPPPAPSPTFTATSTSLVVSPAAATLGGPITLTATVALALAEFGVPTGVVTFLVDGVEVGSAPLVAGVASWTLLGVGPGPHGVIATYLGDATHAASQSPAASFVVLPAPAGATSTTLVLPAGPAPGEIALLLLAIVTTPDGSIPTGSLRFTVEGVGEFVVPVVAHGSVGLATLVLPPLPPAARSVVAEFLGNSAFASSRSDGILQTAAPTPAPAPAPGGPTVTAVEPVRQADRLTGVVVRFSEPIGPRRAVDLRNYHLFTPRGEAIRILGATYDAATGSVLLRIRPRPWAATGRLILVVNGRTASAIVDLDGIRLNASAAKRPGRNTRVVIGARTPRPVPHQAATRLGTPQANRHRAAAPAAPRPGKLQPARH